MPTQWQSQAYRNVYEDLVRQMDPSSIQDKCFARGLITSEQRDNLSHLNGTKHNRCLLSVLEKLNDDQYKVFCQVLLKNAVHVHDHSVAEMRKASDGAAASASTHGQPATSSATSPVEGNPFKTEEYRKIRMHLVADMDMSNVRNRAEGHGLITSDQVDRLSTTYQPIGRVEHNRELFRLMEVGGPEAIRTFSAEVLPFLGQCNRHKADLDRLLAKPVPKALGRAESRTRTKTQFKEREPNSCTPTGSVEAVGGLLPNRTVDVETPESLVGGKHTLSCSREATGRGSGKPKFDDLNSASSTGTSSDPSPMQCEAYPRAKKWNQTIEPGQKVLTSTHIPLRAFAGQCLAVDRTKPIKIIIVNFDPKLSHPQHAEVWTPLKVVVEAALGVQERHAREGLWLHFDHMATVDSIKKAVERVKDVGKDFTGDIIGIVSSTNCNRLAFFHGEQSNSFKPVTDTFRKLPGGKLVAIVTQDYYANDGAEMWRSADASLGMEMQVQRSAMNGDRGLVLSWYKRPYTVHGRALAAFVLGMIRRLQEHAFALQPLPVAVSTRVATGAQPSYLWRRLFPRQQTKFHIIYRMDTFNREVKSQVEQFVNSCLAGMDPLMDTGVAANAEWPIQKSPLPSSETLKSWVFDSKGFRNVAVLFTAADAYYENPSQLDGDISIFLESGFKHCIICAMFDAGFLDHPEDMDRIRSARLDRRVTVPGGPASLVSWYSRPANAIAQELLRTGVVPSRVGELSDN